VKEDYMYLGYVYTSNKTIRCFFYTVVVKIESLVKHYPGSLKGFMENHYPLCNQDISVRVLMSYGDCSDLVEELIENGLKVDEDFVYFDTDMYCFPDEFTWRKDLDLGVGWLKGRLSKIPLSIRVWYNDDYKEKFNKKT
jgi:hypothetical protein